MIEWLWSQHILIFFKYIVGYNTKNFINTLQ